LFDTHTLVHNRRKIQKIEISEHGRWRVCGKVDVDTPCGVTASGQDFLWKGRACKVYSRIGGEWKMTMHTGLLEY